MPGVVRDCQTSQTRKTAQLVRPIPHTKQNKTKSIPEIFRKTALRVGRHERETHIEPQQRTRHLAMKLALAHSVLSRALCLAALLGSITTAVNGQTNTVRTHTDRPGTARRSGFTNRTHMHRRRGTEADGTQKPHTEDRVLLRRVASDLEQHMLSSEN